MSYSFVDGEGYHGTYEEDRKESANAIMIGAISHWHAGGRGCDGTRVMAVLAGEPALASEEV